MECAFQLSLFDVLRESSPKEWEHWMRDCYTSPFTGERFGWGHVLDYIGVGWEGDPHGNVEGQLKLLSGDEFV